MIRHNDGTRDKRYTLGMEFTGAPVKQYVARFCGDWIGSANTKPEVVQLAETHNQERFK